MKSTTIAMIVGVLAAVSGFLITPQYAANPFFNEKITGVVLNVIGFIGVIVTAIGGYKANENAKNAA